MNARITRYTQSGGGGRALGITVRGVSVLVQPRDDDQQVAAEALAEQIAALGPEEAPSVPTPSPSSIAAPPSRPVVVPFVVGERVYCTVHGAEGWCTVSAVGAGRNRGRIKIEGMPQWCPAHNFARRPREVSP